jgi:hypothetical protein
VRSAIVARRLDVPQCLRVACEHVPLAPIFAAPNADSTPAWTCHLLDAGGVVRIRRRRARYDGDGSCGKRQGLGRSCKGVGGMADGQLSERTYGDANRS